jgi:hypothetical protein
MTACGAYSVGCPETASQTQLEAGADCQPAVLTRQPSQQDDGADRQPAVLTRQPSQQDDGADRQPAVLTPPAKQPLFYSRLRISAMTSTWSSSRLAPQLSEPPDSCIYCVLIFQLHALLPGSFSGILISVFCNRVFDSFPVTAVWQLQDAVPALYRCGTWQVHAALPGVTSGSQAATILR